MPLITDTTEKAATIKPNKISRIVCNIGGKHEIDPKKISATFPIKVILGNASNAAYMPLWENKDLVATMSIQREKIIMPEPANTTPSTAPPEMQTKLVIQLDSDLKAKPQGGLPTLVFSQRQIEQMQHEVGSYFGAGYAVFKDAVDLHPTIYMTERSCSQLYQHLLGLVKHIDLSKAAPAPQGRAIG